MSRLIRRTIHLWQSWRAKRTHGRTGRVRDLEKRKRDEMTRALGGNV